MVDERYVFVNDDFLKIENEELALPASIWKTNPSPSDGYPSLIVASGFVHFWNK
jgi:hypothetical protein